MPRHCGTYVTITAVPTLITIILTQTAVSGGMSTTKYAFTGSPFEWTVNQDIPSAKAKRHLDEYSDPLTPTNLVVHPAGFGALNISWDLPSRRLPPGLPVTHFEVALQNLTDPADVRGRVCSWYATVPHRSESGMIERLVGADSIALHLSGLLPDTFYSVEVRACLRNGTCASIPARLPSSAPVPAAPPSGSPTQIQARVAEDGKSAVVSWSLPKDIECNGKLMGYIMELNSSYDTSQGFNVDPQATQYLLSDLMPGTDYMLRMLASTHGGLGRWSHPVHFRTHGQAQQIDLEAFVTSSPLISPSMVSPFLPSPSEGEFGSNAAMNALPNYRVPDKILNFRGEGRINAIHLSWTIKWRPQRVPGQSFSQMDWSESGSLDLSIDGDDSSVDSLPMAPNVMLRLTWHAGESEPISEETISARLTSYPLKNLRSGAPYHIRLIAIIPGEDGPSAYTVATPRSRNKDTQDSFPHHPIPVNLLVQHVTPTEATLQWELPRQSQKAFYNGLYGFQVRYQPTRRSDSGDSAVFAPLPALAPAILVNISDPGATRLVLRRLQPETVYEFAVRALFFGGSAAESEAWSMVQGFETPGQRPKFPPQNITISAVMNSYLPTQPVSILPTIGGQSESSDSGDNSASILVTWQRVPSVGPRGTYHIYFTPAVDFMAAQKEALASHQRRHGRRSWNEYSVPGGQNSTVLHNLRSGSAYFLLMNAQNRFGPSPLSSFCFFRTADADGSGFINLNVPMESYEAGMMSPGRIQRLTDEMETLLKSVRSSEESAKGVGVPRAENEARQNQWVLVAAVLAVVAVVILILAVAVALGRKVSCSRVERARKRYFAEQERRSPEKGDINGCIIPPSHSSTPSCCDASYGHRIGSSGLECLMHSSPAPVPSSHLLSQGGMAYGPYGGLPYVIGGGCSGDCAGGGGGGSSTGGGGATGVSGSINSQSVLVHGCQGGPGAVSRGGCGSESDCRTTPIDSDLESAKSANLVTAFPCNHHHHHHHHGIGGYHHHHQQQQQQQQQQHLHHTMSPIRQRNKAGGSKDGSSPAHAGLIDRGDAGSEGKNDAFYHRGYPQHPINLPPKMDDLFPTPATSASSPSTTKSGCAATSRSPILLSLPYRDAGRLGGSAQPPTGSTTATPNSVGGQGGSELATEASRSIAGSSGYGSSGAPAREVSALTESFMARNPSKCTTLTGGVNSGTLQRKYMAPDGDDQRATSDDVRYENHASVKLNNCSKILPIPRISALQDDKSLSKVYSSEELTEEMANLEGLMKDLKTITRTDFECTSEL